MTTDPIPTPATGRAAAVDRRLSVAPMMDWTDRHDRWFLRRITRDTLLYTEMVTTGALLFGDPARHLAHDPEEQPLALQLGGSDPEALARSVRIAGDWGFAEINLNVGCPSDRVQNGRFGACLMAEPDLVADCVAAMRAATPLPVTVKHRIGIDDRDSWDELLAFVDTVARAGCSTFIVHARKAWLQGLSPKENREIPPLRHDVVQRLKAERPHLEIILNGGVTSLAQAEALLGTVDGVMIGRAAYETPWMLAGADRLLRGDPTLPLPDRHDVADQLVPYADRLVHEGQPVKRLTRHIMGLFHGEPGARAWRRHLSEMAVRPEATGQVIAQAHTFVPRVCDATSQR